MLKTHAEVALIDIVGTDAVAHQFVHQFFHHMHTVVHTTQQDGLVAERDTGVGQFGNGFLGFGSHLVGVVEVGVQPDGMVFLEHVAEIVGDALGANHGGAAADADYLDMGDGAEAGNDIFQFSVAHHEGIATREEHVAHFGGTLDVLDALLDAVLRRLVILLACKTTAGAVAAIHGAHVGDEEQNAVRVAVGESGSGRILVLVQRVVEVGGSDVALGALRDGLTADGVEGVVRVDKAQVVGRDGHAELGQGLLDTLGLFGLEGEVLAQLFVGLDAVFHLPFPIVPLLVGDVREQFFSAVYFHIFLIINFQNRTRGRVSPARGLKMALRHRALRRSCGASGTRGVPGG